MTPSLQKSDPQKSDPRKNPGAKHRVHIRIDGSSFRYARPGGEDAATITVSKGDHVTWHCEHGNYSVLFKKHSPFGDIAFHGRQGKESASAVITGDPGAYHYAVTVALDGQMLVDDPVILVDNDGN